MRRWLVSLLFALLQCAACAAPPPAPTVSVRFLDPPAAADSFAPRLSVAGEGALLSWLERHGEHGHRLRFARLDGDRWSEATTLDEGEDFFANWADCPGVVQGGDGSLLAHRLHRIGPATYDYSIELFYRPPGGAWQVMGDLQDSTDPAEYGFVSSVPTSDGVRAFWLDGRAMAKGEGMQLRTAVVRRGVPSPSMVLDERVCECCQTAAAKGSEGPIVAYRDRSLEEVRDIAVVRWSGGRWSEPVPIHVDGWEIPGCPVNGPAIAAAGQQVAIAWFTAAGDRPRVLLALSGDAGRSFAAPQEIDADGPIGRVDVALEESGASAWVSWIGTSGPTPAVLLRRVGPRGRPGPVLSIAETSTERAAGFPHLVRLGGRLLVVWVEEGGETSRIRGATVSLDAS